MGYLLKKVQNMYSKDDIVMLNQEEFCKDVNFKYGLPLIMLDLFDYLTGMAILPTLLK